MSWKHLGEVFDIHAGGIDLVFPHHENEVAQSRCCFGTKVMARYWMHNGFLQVEGEKMAKSAGNFVTIRELLTTSNFGDRSWTGEVLRLAMLRTHYRQPIDWTVKALEESAKILAGWRTWLIDRSHMSFIEQNRSYYTEHEPSSMFLQALEDDLNTPLAIAELHRLSASKDMKDAEHLYASMVMLGVTSFDDMAKTQAVEHSDVTLTSISRPLLEALISARTAARAAKNWKESDRIRDELAARGIALKDNKDGTTTWEVAR
jgi:cysteinyl-tRNA synthetase